ncbi:tyrosine-type recombinase/integrase [Acetobacterium wieringae]|uniref:Tyrosine recombinase XerD n=1 Tax=Acetobacterium wieringae TaxID=52694 RepID=A0A1F2PDH3_9FIRM|nr:tyrosine-type recombinase/integrase [Acetobacterium wieringae]OFV68932.1 tyrosine recombinase XerD [Acetobacterium wieringae]
MKKRPSNPIKDIDNVLNIQDYLLANSQREQEGLRNYVLFVVGITTGFRAGDLVKLQVRDVKEAIRSGEFLILEGKKKNAKNIREKNRKPRSAEILPAVAKILRDYIKDKQDYDYMFPSRKGGPIGVQAVSNILKDAGEYFGLRNISAHSMRKTYAYKIFRDNVNFHIISDWFNHNKTDEKERNNVKIMSC